LRYWAKDCAPIRVTEIDAALQAVVKEESHSALLEISTASIPLKTSLAAVVSMASTVGAATCSY
jgi:hypothetical protein